MSSEPRPSATVCVLHQGATSFEVLMVRRSSTARFMAGAWVFPGGVVDPEDHSGEALDSISGLAPGAEIGPWLAAAFREVAEETGIWLTDPVIVEAVVAPVYSVARKHGRIFPAARAAYFANWITPTMVPVRFDARFFLVAIDRLVTPQPDEAEIDDAEFVSPSEVLRRADAGEWLVPFPTQRTLRQIAEFSTVDAAIDEWQHKEVVPVQPRMRVAADGSLEVVMPTDPGFAELDDAEPNPEVLARAAKAAAERGRPIAEVASDDD
ncbi:MAG: NUDIX hydrolase [bacterium]|nr:NUDIX hydrolase [bacterium]